MVIRSLLFIMTVYIRMIIMQVWFFTHKKKKNTNKYLKIEEKGEMAVKKMLSNKSSSDGKLMRGDIPTSHLWSQAVTTLMMM